MKLLITQFPPPSLLGPNILLSTSFSNTINVFFPQHLLYSWTSMKI